jgi:hypothetical protein
MAGETAGGKSGEPSPIRADFKVYWVRLRQNPEALVREPFGPA